MKHTIKLLTVAITLAAILTLTGCPGPVTPDKPCTHENTKTEVIEEATYNSNGLGKIVCVDCEEVIDEQAEISRFVAGGYDGDIPPTEDEYKYRYEHNEEDDYQIMAYVYSSVEDAQDNNNNREVLYFSFPSGTTQIDIGNNDTINSLIQLKGYVGKIVKYWAREIDSKYIGDSPVYPTESVPLTELVSGSPIYIVIE